MNIGFSVSMLLVSIVLHIFFGVFAAIGVDLFCKSDNPLHKLITVLCWPYGALVIIASIIKFSVIDVIKYYKEKKDACK